MKNAALFLFFLTALTVSAQQSVLNGTVTVFNSQFETGKKQYVTNAQVEEDYGKSQATTTNTEGVFQLPLVGIKDLEKVFFNVKKVTYEVVNTDALQAAAGQKEAVHVFMALEGVLAENKRKYYQINLTASEKAVTEKLVQLGQQIETFQQNKEANKTKIETLQAEYARLQESFKKIEETARELAERYVKTNLDDASVEYQRAFRYFQRGLLDSALFVFQKMDLEQTAQKVVSEQNRTAALKTEYETRNTEKNKQKVQTADALLFKANLHQTKFEFSLVEECYDLLIRLDSNDILTLWHYAYFLSQQKFDKKAIALYEKALSISKSDAVNAILQNNLGALYLSNQKLAQAEMAFTESLKIEKLLAEKDSTFLLEVAKALNNLGELYRTNKKFPEAETALTEALQIQRQMKTQNPNAFLPLMASTLNNLGSYYEDMKKMPQADTAYEEALKIYRQLASKSPDAFLPQVAEILNNQGIFYFRNKKMALADSAYTEALTIRRQLANKNPNAYLPDVAQTLINSAIFLLNSKKLKEAEEQLMECLSILRPLAKANPAAQELPLARTLLMSGFVYEGLEETAKSQTCYAEALNIALKYPDVPFAQLVIKTATGKIKK